MVNSNTEPEVIFLDYIENGRAKLLVRWNIKESTKEDPMTKEIRKSFDYSERVIWWTLPKPYATLEDVLAYIKSVQEEILEWAMATDLNFNKK